MSDFKVPNEWWEWAQSNAPTIIEAKPMLPNQDAANGLPSLGGVIQNIGALPPKTIFTPKVPETPSIALDLETIKKAFNATQIAPPQVPPKYVPYLTHEAIEAIKKSLDAPNPILEALKPLPDGHPGKAIKKWPKCPLCKQDLLQDLARAVWLCDNFECSFSQVVSDVSMHANQTGPEDPRNWLGSRMEVFGDAYEDAHPDVVPAEPGFFERIAQKVKEK